MTKDDNNRNHSAKYDHRNLMTEIRSIKSEVGTGPWDPGLVDVLYITIFKYDEAGNRIRKIVAKYEGGDPDPVYENTGDNQGWHTISDEFYVRDVSGKEIAIYSGSSLTQWNIWGLDNVGKINADTTRNYYLKDHLGSIRVVLNSINQVISAQDYDAWGYPLENRTYNSTAMRYDFTCKERDNQTTYDYFGARYYDSRIGRWGQVDIASDSYLQFSPYSYAINNTLKFVDPNGMNIDFAEFIEKNGKENVYKIINDLEKITGLTLFLEGTELKYGNGIKGGSSEARIALINAIDNTSNTINVKFTEGETRTEIGGLNMEFNPNDAENFSNGSYGGLNSNTLGYGMTFLHEVMHTSLGLSVGDAEGFGQTGAVVDFMNSVRTQLGKGFGQRYSYNPLAIGNERYIPFDKASLEVMSNVYQKFGKGQFGFEYNSFVNSLSGTKYIKYEK